MKLKISKIPFKITTNKNESKRVINTPNLAFEFFNQTNFTTKFSTMTIQIQTSKPDSAGLKASKVELFAKNHKKIVLEQGLLGTTLEGS